MGKVTVYEDPMYPADKVELELPLTSRVDVEELKKDLGIPEYVDTGYFQMRRAVAILWASRNVHNFNRIFPSLRERICDKPINLCLLGGGAFKLHCRSSNVGPLNRAVNDLDLAIERRRARDAKKLLLSLGAIMGTQFTHFMTSFDRRWTALRDGTRILLRTIDLVSESELPRMITTDVIADRLEMCHTIDLREALKQPEKNMYTIALENLVLSKVQFIKWIPSPELPKLKESGEGFRILGSLSRNGETGTLIGMESKDMRDLCALLLDHEFGDGADELNLDILSRVLERDERLRLTVRLNLSNMLKNIGLASSWGITQEDTSKIERKLGAILSNIPESREKWSKPWWNVDVETPHIL